MSMGLSHLASYSSLSCAPHRISWCCKTVSLCRAGRGVGSQNQSRIQQQKCQGEKKSPSRPTSWSQNRLSIWAKAISECQKAEPTQGWIVAMWPREARKRKQHMKGLYMTSNSKEKLLHPSSLYVQQQLQETGVKKNFLNFYHIKK